MPRLSCKTPAIFCFLVLASFLFAADDWKAGLPLESGGNAAGAAEIYRSWLEKNRQDKDYFEVLKRFLSLQEDTEAFFFQMDQNWNLSPAQKAEIYRWAGRVAELARDPGRAKEWYTKSYNTHPVRGNLGFLLEAAEMDLLMGEYQGAQSLLDFAGKEDQGQALLADRLLLQSRLHYLQGRTDAAYGTWQELERLPNLSGPALLWGVRLNRSLENTQEAQRLERQYLADYPQEGRAVLNGVWAGAIDPSSLFGFYSAPGSADPGQAVTPGPETTPAGGTPPAAEPRPGAFLIQTGSFRDADNARVQCEALKKLGFDAEVRPGSSGGSAVHRVMIINVTSETQAALMQKLRQNGYDGFPVR